MTDVDADLIVIGGGIAGLAVAHDAARTGLRVVVLESAERTGGLLQRGEFGGVAIDLGAESFATRTSGVADLIADAALPLTLVTPQPAGAHLVALGEAGLVRAPLPRRTILGIPADPFAADVVRIIGADGAARVAAESSLPGLRADDEPTLAALVTERCGPVLLERLVDPLCRSVYSQPADAVRLSRVQPSLWRAALEHGSLVAGAGACASEARAGAAVGGIAGGMWRLADELARAAEARGVQVRTGVRAGGVRAELRGVSVTTPEGTLHAHQAVIATGPGAARSLVGEEGVVESRVRVVAALVESAAWDSPPVGSGVIAAPGVASAAKALTHANAKWAWLAETVAPGRHVLRLSARTADAAGLENPADLAREITLLTGIPVQAGEVVAVTSATHLDAVAAAPVSPARRADLARAGIHFAGAAVAGAGLASVIPHARALAASLTSPSSAPSARSLA